MNRHDAAQNIDLDAVDATTLAALEKAVSGTPIAVIRAGQTLGTLGFKPRILNGTIVQRRPPSPWQPKDTPEGVVVVATAMPLSNAARRRLSDEFGTGYIVLDITEAPDSADILLAQPLSPQLLGILQRQFPEAQIVITEIDDDELGVSFVGPVSRMLKAGAAVYLPPRPLSDVAANIRAYLDQGSVPALGQRSQRTGLPRSR